MDILGMGKCKHNQQMAEDWSEGSSNWTTPVLEQLKHSCWQLVWPMERPYFQMLLKYAAKDRIKASFSCSNNEAKAFFCVLSVVLSSILIQIFSSQEPEVVDLARFLTGSGACVEGAGTGTLYIEGKTRLHGSHHVVSPDRIEAGTFMLAAAITRSCISMSPVIPSHVACLTDKLVTAGCKISCASDNLEV